MDSLKEMVIKYITNNVATLMASQQYFFMAALVAEEVHKLEDFLIQKYIV
jgi:hypothetical protein